MSSWRVGGPEQSGTWPFVETGDSKTPFDVISMLKLLRVASVIQLEVSPRSLTAIKLQFGRGHHRVKTI